MKLSIIVPVYNMAAEGKLNFCLDSLVGQTISDYEIIAVDDASTDQSPQILESYERRYPDKVKVIYSPVNKRQGGAKNLGLAVAKGEWIGFIDSDDWVTSDYYEKLLKRAEETGADLVGCNYHLTQEHSMEIGREVRVNRPEQTGQLDHDKYASLILDGGSLVVKIYRRHIILDYPNRFPEGIFYEDNAIANSWMLRASRFAYLDEPLYYYYQHEASTVHTLTEARCRDRLAAARIMLQEAKEFGFLEEYYKEIEYKFTLLFYINTLFTYLVGVKPVSLKFIYTMGKEMKKTFPEFEANCYYQERTTAEEKKMICLQQTSTLAFVAYYRLLWGYRNWRKRK